MSLGKNKDLIRRSWKGAEDAGGDAAKTRANYYKFYSEKTIFHSPTGDMTLEQRMSIMIPNLGAFPDSKFDIDDMVAEGDKVAIRYTWKATHKGTFFGIPATGKRIAVKGMEIDRIEPGKIAEIWEVLDLQSMMAQLGV